MSTTQSNVQTSGMTAAGPSQGGKAPSGGSGHAKRASVGAHWISLQTA